MILLVEIFNIAADAKLLLHTLHVMINIIE